MAGNARRRVDLQASTETSQLRRRSSGTPKSRFDSSTPISIMKTMSSFMKRVKKITTRSLMIRPRTRKNPKAKLKSLALVCQKL